MSEENRRKNPRLAFEIGIVLACKLCAIFMLWCLFFGPDKRPEQTPENVANVLLSHGNHTEQFRTTPGDSK